MLRPHLFELPRGIVLYSDAFAGANGILPGPWRYNAGIWTIASGAAACTPTLGAELLTDGGVENWASTTDLTSWTEVLAGTSTVNQETTTKHGGSNAARLDVDSSNSNVSIRQSVATTVGAWYLASAWIRASAAGKTADLTLGASGNYVVNPGTNWVQYFYVMRATATSHTLAVSRGTAASASIYVDDISVKALTLSDLFASILFSSADVTIQDAVTRVAGCQAGVVLNLDNPASPANFVIGYLDGAGNCVLNKCVGGTYTNVITGAVTYVAGQLVKAIKSGTSYSLWYNGVQIGTTQTISDAGVIANRYHGMFSTNSGNSLDSFSLTR